MKFQYYYFYYFIYAYAPLFHYVIMAPPQVYVFWQIPVKENIPI